MVKFRSLLNLLIRFQMLFFETAPNPHLRMYMYLTGLKIDHRPRWQGTPEIPLGKVIGICMYYMLIQKSETNQSEKFSPAARTPSL